MTCHIFGNITNRAKVHPSCVIASSSKIRCTAGANGQHSRLISAPGDDSDSRIQSSLSPEIFARLARTCQAQGNYQ